MWCAYYQTCKRVRHPALTSVLHADAPRGHHTTRLAARAVLPWLVVVQGLLDAEGAVSVAAEFGLQTVDVVRVARGPGPRPRLRGTPAHVSPLTAFIDVVCCVHAAAMRLGVSSRGSMRAGSRAAVLLHAPTKAPGFAATAVAACLHWVGCMPLGESVAAAQERCGSEVDVVRPCMHEQTPLQTASCLAPRDAGSGARCALWSSWCMCHVSGCTTHVQGLHARNFLAAASPARCMQGIIKAATAKMALELAFQPQPVRIVWPYGGSGSVVLMLDPSNQGSAERSPAAAPRPRTVPPAYGPYREAPGPADARADVADVVINPGVTSGLIEIPMEQQEQGAHTAQLWVRLRLSLPCFSAHGRGPNLRSKLLNPNAQSGKPMFPPAAGDPASTFTPTPLCATDVAARWTAMALMMRAALSINRNGSDGIACNQDAVVAAELSSS